MSGTRLPLPVRLRERSRRVTAMDADDDRGDADGMSGRRALRKTGIAVAGGLVTTAGVVMLVTPGPGIVVTLAGLGILGREFPAARRRFDRLRRLLPAAKPKEPARNDLVAPADHRADVTPKRSDLPS